ncbi:tripartite tricarboxylate transporter substrate binding protein [Orrella sp. JC864]|uniref:Bug family tripartite tricarboxylate transporter substrate binding protein n=1 Tax=Orrella sp. JC864 TaxID=3120298 RepID=UPI0012BC78E9
MLKRALAAMAASLTFLAPAVQAFPDKPVRIVVPFSPGGGTDILARQVAEGLATSEKWNVVVENRPGGNGAVALSSVARAPADGYQVVLALRENIVIAPLLNQGAGNFDPLKDFTSIVHIADAPMVVATGPNSGLQSMEQVMRQAREQPGRLRFGTSGQGSMSHLLLALLDKAANVPMTHVPYKGSNPALTDLVGGHVELVGGSIASAKSFIESGRITPLAVSSAQRVAALPQVPTIAELGQPGFEVVTWYGFFGPAGMPQEVVQTLNAAVNKVLQAPAMQRILAEQGMQTRIGTPGDFDKLFREDYEGLSRQMGELDMNAN